MKYQTSSEKCGVNTVRKMFSWTLVATLTVMLVIAACSEKQEQAEVETAPDRSVAVREDPVTVEDSIEVTINEAWDRVKYGDKTGLYRLEFEYFTRETSYDDYLKRAEVLRSRNDSISDIEVTAISKFEQDSVLVFLNIHFDGPSGTHTVRPDSTMMYYHKGRWIKPTVSKLKDQREYEQSLKEGGTAKP